MVRCEELSAYAGLTQSIQQSFTQSNLIGKNQTAGDRLYEVGEYNRPSSYRESHRAQGYHR